jgi:universal stress protein A
VVPLVVQFGEVPIPPELYDDQRKDAKANLSACTQAAWRRRARGMIYTGDVVGSIMQAVGKFSPDLLVMATPGRAGFAHLLLGSVAESVVRKASCPVLTVRGGYS